MDEKIPSLPTTPPAAQLQHIVTFVPLKTPRWHTTTTGLNPSSSPRFTLSIPLLDRAKVPLGSVLGKEKEKGGLCCIDPAFVPVLIWFLLEGLDSVSAIMESVAVMLVDELKDQGSVFPILSLLFSIFLARCQPSM